MWKICKEDNKYSISKEGNVYSHRNNIIIKPIKRSDGYLQVFLSRKPYYLHRLVASNFIDNINNLDQINHKDKDQENNSVDNLEWCNNSMNQCHKNFGKKRGVSFHKANKRWRVTLQNKHLAYVENKEDGYEIFYKAFLEKYGKAPW